MRQTIVQGLQVLGLMYLGAWLWVRRPRRYHVLVINRADQSAIGYMAKGWGPLPRAVTNDCGAGVHIWVDVENAAEADRVRQAIGAR